MAKKYFKGCRVLLSDKYIGPATVIVENGRIVDVIKELVDDIPAGIQVYSTVLLFFLHNFLLYTLWVLILDCRRW